MLDFIIGILIYGLVKFKMKTLIRIWVEWNIIILYKPKLMNNVLKNNLDLFAIVIQMNYSLLEIDLGIGPKT